MNDPYNETAAGIISDLHLIRICIFPADISDESEVHSMTKLWNRDFILLNICVIFASFTNFSLIYLLPVHVLNIGGTNAITGLMTTGMTVTYLITALMTAPLIDRWGRKKMLVLGTVLYALNAAGYVLFADDLTAVTILRILNGVTQGIFFPVPPTVVADVSPKDRMVEAIGYFGIAGALPAVFAPVAGLWIYENTGSGAFFMMTALSAAVSVIYALLMHENYHPSAVVKESRKVSIHTVLELSVIMPSIAAFLVYAGNSAVNNFALPVGIERNIAGMSLFLSVNNIAMIITRLAAGKLARKVPFPVLAAAGIITLTCGNLLIAFAYDLWLMLIASVLVGVGITLFIQLVQSHVLSSVPDSRRGVAGSTLMLFQNTGNGVGAALFGSTSESIGYMFTYIISAIITLAALPIRMNKVNEVQN